MVGSVIKYKNVDCESTYISFFSILCPDIFEGAEGNLRRVVAIHSFSGNEQSPAHVCVARLLSLLQLWDCEIPDYDSVNQESEVRI